MRTPSPRREGTASTHPDLLRQNDRAVQGRVRMKPRTGRNLGFKGGKDPEKETNDLARAKPFVGVRRGISQSAATPQKSLGPPGEE